MPENPAAEADETSSELRRLEMAKVQKLTILVKRKPSDKHYKAALKEYLDADGEYVKMLIGVSRLH